MVTYKGLMFNDIPNFANVFGYTNASWTLKADLTCQYVCRLLNHMNATGTDYCVPRLTSDVEIKDMVPLDSGYFKRAIDKLPREGTRQPWQQHHDYFADMKILKDGDLEDGAMVFEKRTQVIDTKPVAAE